MGVDTSQKEKDVGIFWCDANWVEKTKITTVKGLGNENLRGVGPFVK